MANTVSLDRPLERLIIRSLLVRLIILSISRLFDQSLARSIDRSRAHGTYSVVPLSKLFGPENVCCAPSYMIDAP